MLVAGAIGIGLLVAGVLRLMEMGSITLSSVAMPLIGVFLLAVAIWAGRDLPAARELDSRGVVTQGKVIDKWGRTDSEGDRECYVAYEYGDGYRVEEKVSSRVYAELEVGDEVEIRYLAREPNRCRMEKKWYE
jgi:hypothetical protein